MVGARIRHNVLCKTKTSGRERRRRRKKHTNQQKKNITNSYTCIIGLLFKFENKWTWTNTHSHACECDQRLTLARYFVRAALADSMHLYILLFHYNCTSVAVFFLSSLSETRNCWKQRFAREWNSFGCMETVHSNLSSAMPTSFGHGHVSRVLWFNFGVNFEIFL